MSGAILILIGLLLCLTGAWSVRLAVLAAGFGVSWLLADTFGASTGTALLIGASGALLAFLLSLVLSKLMLFFVGGVVGAVVGAKLFVLLDGKDASALLAVIFIPTIAFLFAFLAQRWSRNFLAWATAFGGAAIALTGLGRLAPDHSRRCWHRTHSQPSGVRHRLAGACPAGQDPPGTAAGPGLGIVGQKSALAIPRGSPGSPCLNGLLPVEPVGEERATT